MRRFMLASTFAAIAGTALATADGPDYWRLSGDAGADIRVAADAESAKVGEIPPRADGLANYGCNTGFASYAEWEKATPEERRAARDAAWCRVGFKDRIGWVMASRLVEGGPAPHSHDFGEQALDGTRWLLVDLGGQVPGAKATAVFEGNSVSGNGGCNQFSANVTEEEDGLHIGPILTTRMRCEATRNDTDRMSVDETEEVFLDALAAARSIIQGGEIAALFDDEDRLLATLQRAPD